MFGVLLASLSLGAAPAGPLKPAGPAPVAYAQATGYFKKDSRPTLYQPLNMLDAREITAWCSTTGDPLADTVTFGFKGSAKIDEVRIYTGNGFDEQVFRDFGRARKVLLRAGKETRVINLEDHRGLQAFPVDPPLKSDELGLEVQDVFPAEEDPDVPVCLTDVVFYSDGKPLNGAWLTQKLKFDRDRAQLLGTWYAGEDKNPTYFLSFAFDDTYRMVFRPFEKEASVYTGSYDASASRMSVDIPGKGRLTIHAVSGQAGETRTLSFDGGALPDDWKQKFRSRP